MAHLVRFDPFEEIRALQRQFMSDDWFAPVRGGHMSTTDVYTEDDKQLTIEAHLPNFSEDDVSVQVDKGRLVIQAEKHEQEKDKKKKYVVRESSASFYRSIRLPEHADPGRIKAAMDSGVLKVTVPFKTLPQPKKIAISSGKKR